jgi:hypothetical protein
MKKKPNRKCLCGSTRTIQTKTSFTCKKCGFKNDLNAELKIIRYS